MPDTRRLALELVESLTGSKVSSNSPKSNHEISDADLRYILDEVGQDFDQHGALDFEYAPLHGGGANFMFDNGLYELTLIAWDYLKSQVLLVAPGTRFVDVEEKAAPDGDPNDDMDRYTGFDD